MSFYHLQTLRDDRARKPRFKNVIRTVNWKVIFESRWYQSRQSAEKIMDQFASTLGSEKCVRTFVRG